MPNRLQAHGAPVVGADYGLTVLTGARADRAVRLMSFILSPEGQAILARHAAGHPGSVVMVNGRHGGLVLFSPGQVESVVLYPERV